MLSGRILAKVITNANLEAAEMAIRIIRALSDPAQICDDQGQPFVDASTPIYPLNRAVVPNARCTGDVGLANNCS
jgi:hypothetical protein